MRFEPRRKRIKHFVDFAGIFLTLIDLVDKNHAREMNPNLFLERGEFCFVFVENALKLERRCCDFQILKPVVFVT